MNKEINPFKNEISNLCENIESFFAHIEHKLKVLKSEQVVLHKNNTATLHTFCLDSLNFQMRIFKTYNDNYKKIYQTLNNQIYRDYYKLFKLMAKYILQHINEKKIIMLIENDTYPVYKDLEVYMEYDFNIIKNIHENIVNIITGLSEYCNQNKNTVKEQKNLIERGYDIENLMKSHIFSTAIIESHITLYKEYLELFKQNKEKYLNELYTKVYNLYYEMPPVNENISNNIKNMNIDEIDDNNTRNNVLPELPSQPPTPKSIKSNDGKSITSNYNNSFTNLRLDTVNENDEEQYHIGENVNNNNIINSTINTLSISDNDSKSENISVISTLESNDIIETKVNTNNKFFNETLGEGQDETLETQGEIYNNVNESNDNNVNESFNKTIYENKNDNMSADNTAVPKKRGRKPKNKK